MNDQLIIDLFLMWLAFLFGGLVFGLIERRGGFFSRPKQEPLQVIKEEYAVRYAHNYSVTKNEWTTEATFDRYISAVQYLESKKIEPRKLYRITKIRYVGYEEA